MKSMNKVVLRRFDSFEKANEWKEVAQSIYEGKHLIAKESQDEYNHSPYEVFYYRSI